MNFKSALKKGSIISVLGLGLSVSAAAIPTNTAHAAGNTNANAQKLVDSLKALNIDQVDYLYAYLQSITLSNKEYNGILSNAKQVSKIVNGKDIQNLPNAQKVEVLRLFLDSVKLAHLQASVVDEQGNPINVLTYKAGSSTLVIQLKDLKGNVLATLNPTRADLNPASILAKINALEEAVKAKRLLDQTGSAFVPMPAGDLPKTATNDPEYIALGALLMLMGGIAVVPAVRLARKSNGAVEA